MKIAVKSVAAAHLAVCSALALEGKNVGDTPTAPGHELPQVRRCRNQRAQEHARPEQRARAQRRAPASTKPLPGESGFAQMLQASRALPDMATDSTRPVG